jgi:hypothetical protein
MREVIKLEPKIDVIVLSRGFSEFMTKETSNSTKLQQLLRPPKIDIQRYLFVNKIR